MSPKEQISKPVRTIIALTLLATAGLLAENLGHRLGGDLYPPENSLYSLEQLIKNHLEAPNFKYAELDIRESKDGKLIVFHDEKISPEVNDTVENRNVIAKALPDKTFKNVRISDLTLAQIKELKLPQGFAIPTLLEVYKKAYELGLSRPLMVEVKSLHSDRARSQLIEIANEFDGKITTQFMSFERYFKSSFPDELRWGVMFKRNGYPMYKPLKPKNAKNDRFSVFTTDELQWNYRTITEQTIHFNTENARTKRITVNCPPDEIGPFKIRLGIRHGYDDTGDRKAHLLVLTQDGEVYLNKESGSKEWEWFQVHLKDGETVTVEYSDHDTKLNGNFPGNMIEVNIAMGNSNL